MPIAPSDAFPLLTRHGGIRYFELMQGYANSYAADGQRLTRACRVHKDDISAWLFAMLDGVGWRRIGPQVGSEIRLLRKLPDKDPFDPGPFYETIWAEAADFAFGLEPHTSTSAKALLFQWYVYHLHYTPRDYDLLPDAQVYRPGISCPELLRWTRREQKDAVEAIGIPGGRFRFVGETAPILEPPAKALPTAELRLTLVGWPTVCVPTEAIQNIQGKVNETVFDDGVDAQRWPFSHHPAGTLLCTGAEYRHYQHPFGVRLTDITFNLAVRNNGYLGPGLGFAGWGHLYHYGSGTWKLVTHDGTVNGRRIYQSADYRLAARPVSGFGPVQV